ncbi:MAG: hypothetical protein OHK0012_12350 [Synechococcales cyanobacterium]
MLMWLYCHAQSQHDSMESIMSKRHHGFVFTTIESGSGIGVGQGSRLSRGGDFPHGLGTGGGLFQNAG